GGGDDRLFVFGLPSLAVIASGVDANGVVGHVTVDARHERAYVAASARTLVLGPPPGCRVERELPGLDVILVDDGGRAFARPWRGEQRLSVLDGPDALPRATSVVSAGALAWDARRRHLLVAEAAAGTIDVVEDETFALLGRLVVDPVATESLLAVDGD